MFLTHHGLEIRCGDMLWAPLLLSPAHKQAVGQAPVHAQDEHGFGILNPASVVIVGNIQPLMEPTFNPPTLPVEREPLLCIQPLDGGAGNQGDLLGCASLGLTQESASLGGEWKTDVFGPDCSGGKDPILRTSLVGLESPSLSGSVLVEGGNPLLERSLLSECCPTRWAGFFYT